MRSSAGRDTGFGAAVSVTETTKRKGVEKSVPLPVPGVNRGEVLASGGQTESGAEQLWF